MPLIPIYIQNAVIPSVDSRKRASAFNWCNPYDHILPLADSSITVTDRAWLWGMYTGIAPIDVVGEPACANTVITAANSASIGLMAANVSSMVITKANTATISLTDCG